MEIKKYSLLLLCVLACPSFGQAISAAGDAPQRPWLNQPAPPTSAEVSSPEIRMTLADAVGLGLRQNKRIKSVLIQRVADKFDLRVEERLFYPKATFSASTRTDRALGQSTRVTTISPVATMLTPLGTSIVLGWNKDHTKVLSGNTTDSSLSLSVVQPLLRGAGVNVNMAPLNLARISEKRSILQVKATVGSTVNQIVHAYYQVVQLQDQLKVAELSLQRAQDIIGINRALVQSGRMAASDVTQAETHASQQALAVLSAERGLNSARLTLLTLLGLDPRTRLTAVDQLESSESRLSLEQARDMAFSQRPDYLSQMLLLEATRIGLDVAKDGTRWDLSAIAGVTTRSGSNVTATSASTASKSGFAGLQLTIPIGDLRPQQAQVQAYTSVQQAEIQLEAIRAVVEQALQDSLYNIDTLWRQYVLARKSRELAERSVALEIEKLRSGRSSMLQVRLSQDDLTVAQNAEITSRGAYITALADLDEQLGMTLAAWGIELPQESQ